MCQGLCLCPFPQTTLPSGHPDSPPPSPYVRKPKAHKLPKCHSWEIWGLFLSHPYVKPYKVLLAIPACFILLAPQKKRWPLAFSDCVGILCWYYYIGNYSLLSWALFQKNNCNEWHKAKDRKGKESGVECMAQEVFGEWRSWGGIRNW